MAVALVEAEKAKVVKGVAVREVAKAVGDMVGQVVKEVERAEPAAAGRRWPVSCKQHVAPIWAWFHP